MRTEMSTFRALNTIIIWTDFIIFQANVSIKVAQLERIKRTVHDIHVIGAKRPLSTKAQFEGFSIAE